MAPKEVLVEVEEAVIVTLALAFALAPRFVVVVIVAATNFRPPKCQISGS